MHLSLMTVEAVKILSISGSIHLALESEAGPRTREKARKELNVVGVGEYRGQAL